MAAVQTGGTRKRFSVLFCPEQPVGRQKDSRIRQKSFETATFQCRRKTVADWPVNAPNNLWGRRLPLRDIDSEFRLEQEPNLDGILAAANPERILRLRLLGRDDAVIPQVRAARVQRRHKQPVGP